VRAIANDLARLAVAVSRIPYGRASAPTAEAVLREQRGTCSTKHLLFAAQAPLVDPGVRVELVHRVYRVERVDAERRWGPDVAAAVPPDGLVDVHTYAVVHRGDAATVVDVTFPIDDWDGRTDLPLACASGDDVPAGPDPLRTKAELVERHCEPAVREPFIAALGRR
jgi:hypothetical protein